MSIQITTAFVKAYAAGIRLLQQQRDSRLRMAVLVDNSVVGDREFYDQVSATAMSQITNRHGDTTYTDTPHARRMVTLDPYDVADLVDRSDERRLLNNPVNSYSRSMAMAANRQIDDILFPAFDATASTGNDGSGSAAFDANFSNTEIGGAGTVTIADLTLCRSILEAAENDEDEDDFKWFCAVSADFRRRLLNNTTLTSADFNTVKALVNGQIDQFLGFQWLKSQRSQIDASDVRDTFFWVKSSMQLAISQDATAFIDRLPTKRHSIQVRYEIDAGATRLDESGVYRLLSDET